MLPLSQWDSPRKPGKFKTVQQDLTLVNRPKSVSFFRASWTHLSLMYLSHLSILLYLRVLGIHLLNDLRNRKHFPCFYRVIETQVEVWENKKCSGNMSHRRVFPQPFQVLQNFHECFYDSIETRRKYFSFLLENSPRKITKNKEHLIALFIFKMYILYTTQFTRHKLRHHFCVSIKL